MLAVVKKGRKLAATVKCCRQTPGTSKLNFVTPSTYREIAAPVLSVAWCMQADPFKAFTTRISFPFSGNSNWTL